MGERAEDRRVLDQIMKGVIIIITAYGILSCSFFFIVLEVDGIDVESTLEVIIANICLSHFIQSLIDKRTCFFSLFMLYMQTKVCLTYYLTCIGIVLGERMMASVF